METRVLASTVVPASGTTHISSGRGGCVCVGGHRRNRQDAVALSPPLWAAPPVITVKPHGQCSVHTWLVHALHRYTQVPNPTLSTLREDQSTRLR